MCLTAYVFGQDSTNFITFHAPTQGTQLRSLERLVIWLADSMPSMQRAVEADAFSRVEDRSRMILQVEQLTSEVLRLEDAHHKEAEKRELVEQSLAATLEKQASAQTQHDVAYKEMESDLRMRHELIKDLRIKLEETGAEVERVREEMRTQRSQTAQMQGDLAKAKTEVVKIEQQRYHLSQELEVMVLRCGKLQDELTAAQLTARDLEHDKQHESQQLRERLKELVGELEASRKRVQEVQTEWHETQIDLRAAEERAAALEAELPSALDKAESLEEDRKRQTRQLELVGEYVLDLEQQRDTQALRIQELEKAHERFIDESARNLASTTTEHEEELLAQVREFEEKLACLQLEAERERNLIEADREGERATWAMERERMRKDLAAALELERSTASAAAFEAQQAHDKAHHELCQNLQAVQDKLRESERRLEQVVAERTAVEAEWKKKLASAQEGWDAVRGTLDSSEAELKSMVSALEEKNKRGAEERRALEVAAHANRCSLARALAAHQRLLDEQRQTRTRLSSTPLLCSIVSPIPSLFQFASSPSPSSVTSSPLEVTGVSADDNLDKSLDGDMTAVDHEVMCRRAIVDLQQQVQDLVQKLDAAEQVTLSSVSLPMLARSFHLHRIMTCEITNQTHTRKQVRQEAMREAKRCREHAKTTKRRIIEESRVAEQAALRRTADRLERLQSRVAQQVREGTGMWGGRRERDLAGAGRGSG
jgi:hypothetical protein